MRLLKDLSLDSKEYSPVIYEKKGPIVIKRLKNVSVLPEGYLFKSLTPVEESFVLTTNGYLKTLNWKGLLPIILKRKKVKLPRTGKYAMVHNFFYNYFHWVAESLPRLMAIRKELETRTLLLPKMYTAPFYAESLQLLGIKNVLWMEEAVIYKALDLLFPTVAAPQQHYHPAALKEVSDYFTAATKTTILPPLSDHIYISRAKADRRKIINDEAVIKVFGRQGFSCICLEDFSFAQQIQIGRQAKVLVSIHGAGLTNMMFMQPGTKVLELRKFDKGEMNYYYNLAVACGLNYYYQFCPADDETQPVMYANLIVNIPELEKNIALMLEGQS